MTKAPQGLHPASDDTDGLHMDCDAPEEEPDEALPRQDTEPGAEGDPNKWDAGALDLLTGHRMWGGSFGGGSGRPLVYTAAATGTAGMPTSMAFGGGGGGPSRKMMMARAAAPMPCPPMMAMACAPAPCAAPPGGRAIGFKTGGAQDVSNFRENIKAGHLPLPSDVTFEGVVKDYFFDTSSSDAPPCTELFCPTYSLALAPDPLLAVPGSTTAANTALTEPDASPATQATAVPPPPQQEGAQDVFLAVGLDSGITNFQRPRLNLVILLDVSGSMDAHFDSYYYDGQGRQQELTGADARRTKLDVAKEVMKGMMDKLAPQDSVSISLFSDSAATPKRLGAMASADVAGIKAGIDTLETVGGTNFQAGLDEATAQLRGCADCIDGDPATTENRIIVLTDAETNAGDTSETGLMSRLKANAADRFYMTIVGVGLDFNTKLVESITRVKGANYFSVHTPGEFKQRLEEEFDFMVAPLVFDLELRVDPASLAHAPAQHAQQDGASSAAAAAAAGLAAGAGWRVVHVYGSPESEERRLSGGGSIMRINTLFPAAKTEEGVKGGVVLLRMRLPAGSNASSAPPLKLAASYADRSGKQYNTVRTVHIPAQAAGAAAGTAASRHSGAIGSGSGYFQSSGVRKAVALARLVDALQCWLVDEWAALDARPPSSNDSWHADVVPHVGRRTGRATPQAQPAVPAPGGRLHLRPGCPLLPPGGLLEPQVPAAGRQLGQWERQSQPLRVGAEAKAALRQLLRYLEAEVAVLGDTDMRQEVDLVKKLMGT